MTYLSKKSLGALTAALLFIGVLPTAPLSASGTAEITIEQRSSLEALGSWLLMKPDQQSIAMSGKTQTLAGLEAGQYTIFTDPPQGTTVSIFMYAGDEIIKRIDQRQTSFTLGEGDILKFVLQYKLAKVGVVSVDSSPPGIPFQLRGPNEYSVEGVAPASYTNTPIGQYTVNYLPPGCYAPPPKSNLLEEGGRLTFRIDIQCEELDLPEQKTEDLKKQYVSTVVDGNTIIFRDVPLDAWFASSVSTIVKLGILTGYKDDAGYPTGEYGPQNPVTVAELAKISHILAGIDENLITTPVSNSGAIGAWFERYLASAEELGWTIYTDGTIDPLRPATRGEVLVTLLQAIDISVDWQTGDQFSDVPRRTPYAAAIEKAAQDKIVEGHKDSAGLLTGMFGPLDPVNRAEIAKILGNAISTYKTPASRSASSSPQGP